jgi:hypothetical protein
MVAEAVKALLAIGQGTTKQILEHLVANNCNHPKFVKTVADIGTQLTIARYKGVVAVVVNGKGLIGGSTWKTTHKTEKYLEYYLRGLDLHEKREERKRNKIPRAKRIYDSVLLSVALANGIDNKCFRHRVQHLNWDEQTAATTPKKISLLTQADIDAAYDNGIGALLLRKRLAEGWKLEKAMTVPPMTKYDTKTAINK